MATAHRLRSSADIRRTIAARHAAGGAHVVVHALDRRDHEQARVTVVAGRKVGNAVVRNRAKRRLRAILQQRVLPAGTDLVVTAKAGADVAEHEALSQDLARSIARAVRRLDQRAVVADR